MPEALNNVGTYVRRRELSCTLQELETHGSAVLLPNEVLFVDQGDGTFDIKIGDGVTTAAKLPYVIRMSEMKNIRDAAKTSADSAEKAQAAANKIVESVDPDKNGTVSNSEKLDGITASGYARNNFAYNGRDLSKVFASAAELHAAVAAGNFSKINVGDYWPITLSGTVHDFADDADKTLSNAVFNLEVAGIDLYLNYGDTALTAHHLVMCSRDLLPWVVKMRNPETKWHDDTKTNPWLGSALYATLNDATRGVLPLLLKSPLGSYVFAGPNGAGMRFLGETKAAAATSTTGWAWLDRGKLFLPSEREVWGGDTWGEHTWGAGLAMRWPIFEGSMRHVIKGLGNGGSRCNWWCLSSGAGSASAFAGVDGSGYPGSNSAAASWIGAPLCFLLS